MSKNEEDKILEDINYIKKETDILREGMKF
jgi:hypothetical protein